MASHIVNAVRLVELRTRKGLSQSQLATLSQLSKPTIQRAESGDKLRPKAIQSIARALDVLPEELILAPSAGSPDASSAPDPMEALRRRFAEYLKELRTRFEPVQMIGLHAVTTGASYERDFRPKVADLFVEPYILDQYTPPERSPTQWVDKPTAMSIYAQPGPKVLLGPPGSGKSMEVARIVLDLSQPHPTRLSRAFGDRIPIPLILRDLRVGIDTTLRSLVEEFHAQVARGLVALSDLWDCIETGRALILLDGLDEIPPEPRRAIRTAVWDGIEKYKGCEWLATSRVAGFEEVSFERDVHPILITNFDELIEQAISGLDDETSKESALNPGSPSPPFPLPDGEGSRRGCSFLPSPSGGEGRAWRMRENSGQLHLFHTDIKPENIRFFAPPPKMRAIYLAPFDDSQIEEFIQKWYHCRLGRTNQADEAAERLWTAIQTPMANSSDTLVMARIPNLLTILANLFIRMQTFPHGRSRLYREIAEAYIESIDRARRIKTDCRFEIADQWLWLGRIAWEMLKRRWKYRVQHGSSDAALRISHEMALEWIQAEHRLGGNGELSPQEAEGFLRTVQLRSGLLIEQEPGIYAFVHLTFTEYFAACYLTQNLSQWMRDEGSDLRYLPKWSGSPLWHEMLVFAFEEITHLRKRDWGDLFEKVFPWFADRVREMPPLSKERLEDEEGCQRRLLLTRLSEDSMAGFDKLISPGETYRQAIRTESREWAKRVDPVNKFRRRRLNRFIDRWLEEIDGTDAEEFAIRLWIDVLNNIPLPLLTSKTTVSHSSGPDEMVFSSHLDLYGYVIGTPGTLALARMIETGRLPRLTSLDLGDNQIGEAGAKAIAVQFTDLASLHLGCNRIGNAGAQAIAERLTKLTSLDLSYNQIGDAGARAIAERLTKLTTLDLSYNQIGETGGQAIAESLNNLTLLDLGNNQIGTKGARAIVEKLANLTTLDLGKNQIGEAGARAIAQVAADGGLAKLTTLTLWYNQIGDAGARAIAKQLPNLTKLHLGGNRIGDAVQAELRGMMPNCKIYF